MFVRSLIALSLFASTIAEAEPDVRRDSVVKIHTSQTVPDPFRPWTTRQPQGMRHMGTGFVIDGDRLLTNAHVASFADEILIESDKLPRKVSAHVEHIAYDVDLAILRVDEPGFFDLHPAVTFATALPDDQAAVTAIGYPMGGEVMSTTAGVVSRVEHGRYWNGHNAMVIQVDAALNGGNSGGPAFSGDRCIGMSMGGYQNNDANSIGYLIPALVIDRFLRDVSSDGSYTSAPQLDAMLVTTESPDRRRSLGLSAQDSGMTVLESAEETGLQRWDVVTKIGDMPIDDQGYGTVQGKRLQYPAIMEFIADGSTELPLEIIRNGERIPHTATMTTKLGNRLLFPRAADMKFDYFIHGPFVFIGANQHHSRLAYDETWGPALIYQQSPLAARCYDRKAFDDEQIVILASPPFPHRIMRGHEDIQALSTLDSIDGVKVRNIVHARELIRKHQGEFIELEFADKKMDRVLRLNADALAAATEEILVKNSIRRAASVELE